MKREDKIKVLKALEAGDLEPEDLRPPQVFVFYKNEQNQTYEHSGRTYSQEQYEAFGDKLKRKASRPYVFTEGDLNPKEDVVLLFEHATSGDEPC
jgi:hypothetical protein